MAPTAVLPESVASTDETMTGAHDSQAEDGTGKKKRRNRRGGRKKFQNARAAGLDEESALMHAPVDNNDNMEEGDAAHVGNGSNHPSPSLAVQPITSTDRADSSTEYTDAEAGTDREGNGCDKEAPISKKSGSRFDTSSSTWSDTLSWPGLNSNITEDNSDNNSDDPKQIIANWIRAQTRHPYHNLGRILRERIIEHIYNLKHPDLAPEDWYKQMRLMVWRAVVRANFFWKNPGTGVEEGKPQPILRPAGVFENSFDAFVECAAERLDRIGRDLPDPRHVEAVGRDVRDFLIRIEHAGKAEQLEHLAFLLLFDEEQRKHALELGDVQERIRRSITGSAIEWKGLEFMKRGKPPVKALAPTATVVMADAIWRDVEANLHV